MKKYLVLLPVLLVMALPACAHVIDYELDKMSKTTVLWNYTLIGFNHIIPLGFDHILFIACIFFLSPDLKKVILQASMFTLAHSITLGLAMYGVIKPSSAIIEPLIALSIVCLALENIMAGRGQARLAVAYPNDTAVYPNTLPEDKPRFTVKGIPGIKAWRLVMVFLFGMVHGMGFAGALSQLGMPQYAFATALISFNIGVELGQLAIIFALYFFVSRLFSKKIWYRTGIVIPVSTVIALVASWWTIERIFF